MVQIIHKFSSKDLISKNLFISHMVQIIQAKDVSQDSYCRNFISHMVQIILLSFFVEGGSFLVFISHMVQIIR